MRYTLILAFGAGLAACATEPTTVTVVQPSTVGCDDPMFCGHNSPTIATYGMFFFKLDGQPNDVGASILGLTKDGHAYDLLVSGSRIMGLDPILPTLEFGDLAGATIWLAFNGNQYGIAIRQVGKTHEMVPPHSDLETYVLDWSDVTGNWLPGRLQAGDPFTDPITGTPTAVCPEPPNFSGERVSWDESSKMDPWDSLVFEGDVFHAAARTVEQNPDDNVFNIGCAAHLLTKMRLTRNTIHTVGTWRNEQAVMKALSAQYCGKTSFTVDGEELVWRDRNKMDFYTTPSGLEARWDENGALCYGVPRLVASPNKEAQQWWPNPTSDILTECPHLQPCSNTSLARALPDEVVTTGNY